MNLRPRWRDEPEIDLAPLIDVVFLMLIFFMVSTTFIKEASLKISLPQASAQPAVRAAKPIEITVNQQGAYFLDDQLLPDNREETLRQALALRLDGRDPQTVQLIIRADGHTQHLHVIAALDAASRAGFQRIAIATKPPRP